jgi:hypothetical protein
MARHELTGRDGAQFRHPVAALLVHSGDNGYGSGSRKATQSATAVRPPAPSQWGDALDDAGDTRRQRAPISAYAALRNEKETQDNAVFQNNSQLSELAKQLNRPARIVTKPPQHIGADPSIGIDQQDQIGKTP